MANTKLPARLLDTSAIPALNVTGDLTVDTTTLRVDSTNNRVGIGVASSKTTLNIGANDSGQGPILTLENTDTSITTGDVIGQIDFYANDGSTNGTGPKVNIKAVAQSSAGTVTELTFGTSPSSSATAIERMRIDASGLVGIGTNNPVKLLHLSESADGSKLRITRAGVSEWDFSIGNTSTLTGVGAGALEILPQNSGTANELAIGTAGSAVPLVHITNSQNYFKNNVGIGTDSPGDISLKVHSNDSDDYIAIFKQNHASNLGTVQIDTPSDSNARPSRFDFARGGVNKWKTGMVYGDSSNGWGLSDATGSGTALQQTRFLVQPGGSVGIGTTSPDGALTVNSTATTGDMIARFQYGSNDNDVKGIRVNAPNVSGTQAYADFAVDPETGNLGIGAGTSSGNLPIGQANMNNAAIVVTSPAGAAGVGEAIDFQPGESHTRTSVREQHHFGASDVNVQFRRFIYAASGFSNPTKNIITFTASGNYPQACVYAKVRQMGVSVNRAVLAEGMISVEKDSGASSWDVDYATMSNGTTGYSDVSTDFWPIARIGTSVKPAWTTSINGNSITIGILCNRSTNYDRYIIEVEMFSHQSMSHSWEA